MRPLWHNASAAGLFRSQPGRLCHSLIVGILALVFYSQPEVQDYFARINRPAMSE